MKFCLGSRCQQEGGLSARRRVAAIVPLMAVVPAIVTRHSHAASTNRGDFLAGLAVGAVFGIALLILMRALKSRR